MKSLIWIFPLFLCLQSLPASDWILTRYFPWVYDPDNGWYYVSGISEYVWSEDRGQWIRNPISGQETHLSYRIVDTNQAFCYDNAGMISFPDPDEPFFGQDAQYPGNAPSYTDNGDGTITDNVTGLMWQKSPDTDGDGRIGESDKVLHEELESYASAARTGGYSDWRVPTIKELYSLIQFNGVDPSVLSGDDVSLLTPFINSEYFDFAYGDTSAGVRIIDAQYWSGNDYVSDEVTPTTFGVNFADGRIKGYGLEGMYGTGKTMFLMLVRGAGDYGINKFSDNGDNTISDHATGLMWSQEDSHVSMDWEEALAWVVEQNNNNYLGYSDWRLPDIKELQSIVDYTRCPATSNSPAIDPLFSCTGIINENGVADYGYYWSSTTHKNSTIDHPGGTAAYVAFGRSMGYMRNSWIDVHGAGSQRSDPKDGYPDEFPTGRGPQGDAIHILNLVRLVRDDF